MEQNLEMIFGNYCAWKVDEATWVISFMNGSQYLYLLEGTEKALLIDNGYGVGNLRAFVEKLTDKPIVCVNTHFHPDHAAGNGEFEKVYMSAGAPIDEPSILGGGILPFDISKLPYPDYEKCYVGEGDKFDLGDRVVEVMDVLPAHCNSSLFFLDRSHKMLFVGDEFEAAQVMMFDNSKNPEAPYDVKERLVNMKANAERLLGMESEYTFVFPNHNGTPIGKVYLQQFAELSDEIFKGNATVEDKLNHPFVEMDPTSKDLCRVRWKNVSIFIRKDEVMKVYGKGL